MKAGPMNTLYMGDQRGASLMVWAIAEGRKMPAGLDKYLQTGKSAKQSVK